MIVEQILTLPMDLSYEGVVFELSIFKNSSEELRIKYGISYVLQSSKHKKIYDDYGSWLNPILFGAPYLCNFLYLIENISTDENLIEAIRLTKDFIEKHKLV